MATDLQVIIDKLEKLPAEKQRKVLDFVEALENSPAQKPEPSTSEPKSIWQTIEEITNQVPLEAWAEVPADGSIVCRGRSR